MSRNNPDLLYVRVAHDALEGFWEVDTKRKKALFRTNNQKLLPSDNLTDCTETYKTIHDFILGRITEAKTTKEIIKNRKVAFSDTELCSHFTPNRNNPHHRSTAHRRHGFTTQTNHIAKSIPRTMSPCNYLVV